MLYSLYVLYTVRQPRKLLLKTTYHQSNFKNRTTYSSYSSMFTVREFLNQHTTHKRIEVKFYEAHLPQHDMEDST